MVNIPRNLPKVSSLECASLKDQAESPLTKSIIAGDIPHRRHVINILRATGARSHCFRFSTPIFVAIVNLYHQLIESINDGDVALAGQPAEI